MEGKNRLGTVEIDGSEITKFLYVWFLLVKFDCHINVEICYSIKAVKYLYKYIYKGHDRVAFNINYQEDSDNIDEIKNFQAAQWILLYICYASMWVGYFISFGLLSLQGYFSIFAAKHHTQNKTHKQHQPLFDDPCVDL